MTAKLNEQDILPYMQKYGIRIEERGLFQDWCKANMARIEEDMNQSESGMCADFGEALCTAYCEEKLSTVYCEVCGHDWEEHAPCPFH